MGSVNEYFDLLNLPLAVASPADIEAAYRQQRRIWFLKQFEPAESGQARTRLAALDEAYFALRDPRRQNALLRAEHQRRRSAQEISEEPAEAAISDPFVEGPRAVHRTQIVQTLLRAAERLTRAQKRPLDEGEKTRLAKIGLSLGLDYPDSRDIVRRICQRLEGDGVHD